MHSRHCCFIADCLLLWEFWGLVTRFHLTPGCGVTNVIRSGHLAFRCSVHTKEVPWCHAQTMGLGIRGSWVKIPDPHIGDPDPGPDCLNFLPWLFCWMGRIAGNTLLLRDTCAGEGKRFWKSMSSAGGPLAVVFLVFHVHCPPCRALRVHCTRGPLGCLSAELSWGERGRWHSATASFCWAFIIH